VLQYYTAVVARVHGQRTALRGPRRARVGARGTKREGKPKYERVLVERVGGGGGIHRRWITLCTISCAGIIVSPRRAEVARSRDPASSRDDQVERIREKEREREREREGISANRC